MANRAEWTVLVNGRIVFVMDECVDEKAKERGV
jgi:hypothetical protein